LIVSTDDEEIAEVSVKWGAEVPFMRPIELATDDSPHIAVVRHAVDWLAETEEIYPDYIMTLQPTSPLRNSNDIDAAIRIARDCNAPAVVSVCETHHHPYLSRSISDDGELIDFFQTELAYPRRQDLPPAYALNGAIYLNHRESLIQDQTFIPDLTYAYVMPPERSLDIDTSWDLYLAGLILLDKYGIQSDRNR
jgi:N-acylneuraminate cytidylyltransferase/CMP-N,N'-diacetyllegionaminic acid synthase